MSALRRSFAAILRPWVLFALGLLALALVIWFAGPLFAFARWRPLESEGARWMLIAIIVLAFVVRAAWRAWQSRRANTQLTAGLAAEAAAPKPQDEASAAELETLRKRFADAMSVLRSAHLGEPVTPSLASALALLAPRRYVYQLPWYVFIGAPGSGKTTALLNAGLRFPLADKLGEQKLAGIGGTRNCDWWFTDRAVLIDTAGRYTTQESNREIDAAAWTNFLGLLKRHRPRRPLDGVLLTVSVADLVVRSAEDRAAQAEAIRNRIFELHDELGIRLPIYVLVTKADLLAGFMEFFGEMGKEERAQVWGTTCLLDAPQAARAPLAALEAELALLEKRLNERLIDRLQQERDPARRALIYGFPQQLAALGAPLHELLERVFSDSRFAQAGLLRGVYFTSGTQEGTPLDRVVGHMARALGLERNVLAAQRPSGKSFFLTRLLHDVVFQEAGIAGTDRRIERRNAVLRTSALVLTGVLATVLIGVWWMSYQRNRAYVAAVEDRVAPVAKLVEAVDAVQSSNVLALLPLLQSVQDLTMTTPGGVARSGMGYGLYQGDKLGQAAGNAYHRLLQDAFLPRLQLQIESRLRSSVNDGSDALYAALKTYVMLARPEHFDADAFRRYVIADWDASLPRDITAESRGALAAHLDALLAQAPLASPLPIDHKLIADARAGLARVPAAQRIYDDIKRDPAMLALAEFTILAKGGTSAPLVFTRASGVALTKGVPGLYTVDVYRGSFEKRVEAAAKGFAAEEAWVLGTENQGRGRQFGELREEVRRLYLRDYAQHWEAFTGDLRVRRAAGLEESIQLASALSAPDSPLPILLGAIVEQVTLAPSPEEAPQSFVERAASAIASARKAAETSGIADAAGKRAKLEAELVDRRFERLRQFVRGIGGKPPAGLDQVAPLMTELYQHLVAVDTALKRKMPPPPPDVVTKVGAEARRMPEPVGATIAQLAEQATRSQRDVTMRDLNEQFASIAEDCSRAIDGRYPFVRSSATDVLPEDFGRLFGPGGSFDTFVQQELAKHVDTSARPWAWRRTGELAGAMATDGLRQLERAQAIRSVFFRGSGSNRPALKLDFKPLQMDDSIHQFVLDVDGQIVRYAHGPQVPAPVQWPGPRGSGQVRVQLTPPAASGASGLTFEGPWALFRALDRMQVDATPQPERFNVTFNVDGRKTVFEVTTSSVQNPFRLRDLEQFQCPARL